MGAMTIPPVRYFEVLLPALAFLIGIFRTTSHPWIQLFVGIIAASRIYVISGEGSDVKGYAKTLLGWFNTAHSSPLLLKLADVFDEWFTETLCFVDEVIRHFKVCMFDFDPGMTKTLLERTLKLQTANEELKKKVLALERDNTLLKDDISAQALECDDLARERDAMTIELNGLIDERHVLIKDKVALLAERDDLLSVKETLITERDNAIAERSRVAAEREKEVAEKKEMALEKEEIAAERNELAADKEFLLDEKVAMEDQIAYYITKIRRTEASAKRMQEELTGRYKMLEVELAGKQDSFDELMVEFDSLESDLTTSKRILQDRERDLVEARECNARVIAQNTTTSNELQAVKATLAERDAEIVRLKAEAAAHEAGTNTPTSQRTPRKTHWGPVTPASTPSARTKVVVGNRRNTITPPTTPPRAPLKLTRRNTITAPTKPPCLRHQGSGSCSATGKS